MTKDLYAVYMTLVLLDKTSTKFIAVSGDDEKSVATVPIDETYGLYYILSKLMGKTHQLGVAPLLVRRLKAGGGW